jgi:hypothetical protein
MPASAMDKMTAAKRALKEVLRLVPQSTRLGLLVFSAEGLTNDWVHPLGPRNDAELMKAIDSLRPFAGTPLGQYIKQGADRLLEERTKQFGYGTFRLLVVTDGEAQDQALVDRYTPDVIARGITMDVIGVAMKQNHTLARRVHSYRAANDPAALKRALTEVFAEVGGSGTDVAGAEAFATLEPIPQELAGAAIQALASSGNHPIGQRPKAASPAVEPKPESKPAAPAPQVAIPSPAPAPVPLPPAQTSGKGGNRSFLLPVLVVLVILFGILFRRR